MTVPSAPKKARRSKEFQTSKLLREATVIGEDDETDSPFTLFFVNLPNETTVEETQNLQEAFKIAEDAGILPEWIDADAMENLQSSSDFFVLPCFRGQLFQRLQARKIKLYGPPIILECIEEMKLLPQWNHPIYSSVFEGARISITCIEPEKRRELAEKIGWMCGIEGELFHETTHLVVGKAEQTAKYKVAVNNSIKLMRKEWIEDLWETSKTTLGKFSGISQDAINSYGLRVFEGLEMAITLIDGTDRSNLIHLIEEHGGKVPGSMSRSRCSHLITDKTTGQKYTKATEWKTLNIVQTRWVRKCVDLGHLVDEGKYHPKFLAAEHIRSSTPKKDANVTESGPDVSSIAGHGGRLNPCSFTGSSIVTPLEQSHRRQSGSSFVSVASTSNIASSTRRSSGARRSDPFATPIARSNTVPLVRHPTTQPIQEPTHDPIDELRKSIDSGHSELFENCMFYICGVNESRMEKWRRFLNETGATRAPKFDSATNVVVIAPSQQEKYTIRKYLNQEDIAIVTVYWVMECIKKRQLVPTDGFEWKENPIEEPPFTQSQHSQQPASVAAPLSALKTSSKSEKTYSDLSSSQMKGIFAFHTYFIHSSVKSSAAEYLKTKIQNNGGRFKERPDDAEFVVFGNLAPINELLYYEQPVTSFYILSSIDNSRFWQRSGYPLFVPLPRPPLPIFNGWSFVVYTENSLLMECVTEVIQDNGGRVLENPEETSYIVMADPEETPRNHGDRIIDLSWVISSVSRCRLQPLESHSYTTKTAPLTGYQRDDDVWAKCIREHTSTLEMEKEVEEEERHRVEDRSVATANDKEEPKNTLSPYENPYFPDLRKPYKMNLKLDGICEYLENMESPSNETRDTMTTSKIGSILRKAVVNTGRRSDLDEDPSTCSLIRPRGVVPENRKTISSTPVLVRDADRSLRFMPMDESFSDQNLEHTVLKEQQAKRPHFLLSISTMKEHEATALNKAIKQLGGIIENEFNRDVTHLITIHLQRACKVLCSIAAGKWCLTPDYVHKSVAAGYWLDEKDYEWTPQTVLSYNIPDSNPKKERAIRKISEELAIVCKRWRENIANMPITFSVDIEDRRNGAFSGWRCVVHLDDRKAETFTSILEAGGAVVHSISEYVEVAMLKPNMVLASKEFKWNPQSASIMKRNKTPLYIFDIIYDYLIGNDNLKTENFWHIVYKNA